MPGEFWSFGELHQQQKIKFHYLDTFSLKEKEKLACEVFFFLIHHLNQYQSPEPIKASSNVVIAFKWLRISRFGY